DISFSVLPDLTDQDLKDIGVSLGHRRQLLREIGNLDKTVTASPSAPSVTAPPVATPPVEPRPETTGERRHVTVMFCDLVVGTAVARRGLKSTRLKPVALTGVRAAGCASGPLHRGRHPRQTSLLSRRAQEIGQQANPAWLIFVWFSNNSRLVAPRLPH